MSLFGQQPQQQAAPSLFGASSTPQPAATNIFGQSATQPKPLFGQPAPAAPQATPSLFGNPAAPTTNTTGGGLFGSASTPAAPAATGGLFGQAPAAQPTGGLFGSTSTQPAGSSLFGNTATTATQPAATGGLFGSTPAAGGLFGAKPAGTLGGAPTLPALNTGTSLFGGSTLGQQPSAQPSTSSLFGQPAAQKPLFGAPAASTPNLFGASTAAPAATNNLFGASTGAPAAKPLFGTSLLGQPPAAQPNALGTSTLTTSALRTPAPAAGATTQQADAQTQFARLSARIEEITAAWNAASPQCQFQYFFYNRVEPSQVGLYGRPPNATNETLWTKAVRDNPDPTTLVPAIAVGFDDLRQRVDAQGQQATWQLERLKELKTRLEALSSTQHQNSARLTRLAASQTQLTHRLLALAAHLHLLVPSLRSSGIRVEEEELRGWLEELREEIGTPGGGGGGRMRGKLGELWALVGAIGAQQQQQHQQQQGEWKVVDEDGLARIAQILGEQQAGLVHLTKILKGDLADINVVLKGGRAAQDGDGVDLLSSRRSVIR